jgi:hypothetical protein
MISKVAFLTAAVHFVALTAPSVALAQDRPGATSASTGGDVIDLKNGGILRGTIIDAIPNGHARIQLATGEVATVPWQDIARIERGSAAPAPAATTPAGGDAAPVWVHIEGSEAAQLQRDSSGNHREWTTVCSAPCDQAVSPQFDYRIAGDGIRNSRIFTLSAHGGEHETLAVDEGSRGGFVLGIVSTSVGGLVMVIGLVVVLANATARLVDGSDGASSSGDRNGETLGWGISAVGLAGIIGGVVLIASNSKTGVTQSSAPHPTGVLPSIPGAPMIGFRDPLRDGARESILKGAFAPAVGIPIFGGRF